MQTTIPPHLTSTYKLISSAFPDRMEPEEYFALLAIVYDQLSDRNLAEVMTYCSGKDYGVVLNDIYSLSSTNLPKPGAIAGVKQHLMRCGYEAWLKEE